MLLQNTNGSIRTHLYFQNRPAGLGERRYRPAPTRIPGGRPLWSRLGEQDCVPGLDRVREGPGAAKSGAGSVTGKNMDQNKQKNGPDRDLASFGLGERHERGSTYIVYRRGHPQRRGGSWAVGKGAGGR